MAFSISIASLRMAPKSIIGHWHHKHLDVLVFARLELDHTIVTKSDNLLNIQDGDLSLNLFYFRLTLVYI